MIPNLLAAAEDQTERGTLADLVVTGPAGVDPQLAATIAAVDCDTVVIATPVDLARLIPIGKPCCRVHYDLEEISHPDLTHVICEFFRARA